MKISSIFILIPFSFFICVLIGCSNDNTRTSQSLVASSSSVTHDENTKEKIDSTTDEDLSRWIYSEQEDKMSDNPIKTASIVANEQLEFDFPYSGGATATLTIRKKNSSTDVYLRISTGQFHGDYENPSVRIKFDNEKPKRYSYSEAEDASSDIIFLNSERELIAKMEKAKKMIIEAEFYQEGRRQMEFDVAGLKW
jgi:hypothetical protein